MHMVGRIWGAFATTSSRLNGLEAGGSDRGLKEQERVNLFTLPSLSLSQQNDQELIRSQFFCQDYRLFPETGSDFGNQALPL